MRMMHDFSRATCSWLASHTVTKPMRASCGFVEAHFLGKKAGLKDQGRFVVEYSWSNTLPVTTSMMKIVCSAAAIRLCPFPAKHTLMQFGLGIPVRRNATSRRHCFCHDPQKNRKIGVDKRCVRVDEWSRKKAPKDLVPHGPDEHEWAPKIGKTCERCW